MEARWRSVRCASRRSAFSQPTHRDQSADRTWFSDKDFETGPERGAGATAQLTNAKLRKCTGDYCASRRRLAEILPPTKVVQPSVVV